MAKPKTPHLKLAEIPLQRLSNAQGRAGGRWYEILEVTNSVDYSIGNDISEGAAKVLLSTGTATTKLVKHPRFAG